MKAVFTRIFIAQVSFTCKGICAKLAVELEADFIGLESRERLKDKLAGGQSKGELARVFIGRAVTEISAESLRKMSPSRFTDEQELFPSTVKIPTQEISRKTFMIDATVVRSTDSAHTNC